MRLALLAAIALASSIAAQEPLAIGIMRQDGLLIPFAIVSGDRYQPLSVEGPDNSTVFTNAAKRLNNTEWTLWRCDESSGTAFRVLSPETADSHCTRRRLLDDV
jgi:hypothetical protein